MVDNSPIVCCGEEPNFILIKDFFGKDNMDDEVSHDHMVFAAISPIPMCHGLYGLWSIVFPRDLLL